MNSALLLHLFDDLDTLMLWSSWSMLRAAAGGTSSSTITTRYELSTDHGNCLRSPCQVIRLVVVVACTTAR